MRYLNLCLLSVAFLASHTHSAHAHNGLVARQDNTVTDTVPPGETTAPPAAATTAVTDNERPTEGPTLGQSDESSSSTTSERSQSSRTQDVSASTTASSASETAEPSSTSAASATTEVPNLGPSETSDAAASQTSEADQSQDLPIQPRITPAFGLAGVILIVTGIGYGLIGVKHRLIQIFLSNAYLAALAVTVLIDYVMKPPISDAIQGAYFVAIFMTGAIFGGGSLIFKEVTEGFGCLLGGFCLAMWLLCLKPGGLITDQTGIGIMVGVFSLVVWAFSWSHYTRNYGLIGSTAFAGATAFVLGIDCFSRAGLKEFWFYIWQLNNNLFPLGTDTYPMTRGMIVELIVVVLATIIGVLSQIKLWKIVRDRRKRRDQTREEDVRRQEVVEEAIGRHLERQNDRDRTTWEKQYGNTIGAKRSTILWSEAHPEKSVTHIVPYEDKRLSSVESLEMSSVGQRRSHRSQLGMRNKRASNSTVNVIPEEEEEGRASMERKKALAALDPSAPAKIGVSETVTEKSDGADSPVDENKKAPEVIPLPFKIPHSDSQASLPISIESGNSNLKELTEPKRASKRLSIRSLLSLAPRLSTSSDRLRPSESQDHLAAKSVESLALSQRRLSRASSLAATLDEDHDKVDLNRVSRMIDLGSMPGTPTILISPVDELEKAIKAREQTLTISEDVPPSPTEVGLEIEDDPEEMPRPVSRAQGKPTQPDSETSGSSERHEIDSSGQQQTTAASSVADGLTKGALEQVPSQVSNVVMSYRTNEWAKHIADADEPVFTEPEQMESDDTEAPVQLAPRIASLTPESSSTASTTPVASRLDPTRTLSASSTPPPPHVASPTSAGVVANVQEPQRTLTRSGGAPVISTTVPVLNPAPATRPTLKNKRSSTLNRSSTAIKPILEDEVTTFSRSQSRQSQAPTPQRVMSPVHMDGTSSPRVMSPTHGGLANRLSSTPQQPYAQSPYGMQRNNSRTSVNSSTAHEQQGGLSRSSSYMSGIQLPVMSRSDTRLDMYDSRQPQKRDLSGEQQKREALLTEWRMGQQTSGLINQIPKESVEMRRAQMLLDREHKRLMDDQERANRHHRQAAMDQVMRQPVMQDAHREAMRRMQASVSK
jgi:hypothetical protein